MDVLTRNFFKLLRAGGFQDKVIIEPLSAWKWHKLSQLAQMHGVADIILKGLELCKDQFFVQPPKELLNAWHQAVTKQQTEKKEDCEESDLLTPNRLTNPILNHKLQNILDDEGSNIETRQTLLLIVSIARYFMNEGFPFLLLVELGKHIKNENSRIDYTKLKEWIIKLNIGKFAEFEDMLLCQLFGFTEEEIPFSESETKTNIESLSKDIFRLRKIQAGDWYFSQGDDIFVHSQGSMLWHLGRSLRFFKYYPSESITNFIASFAHSLSHIEE